MRELFEDDVLGTSSLVKATEIVPEIRIALAYLFSIATKVRTVVNTKLLPLVSSKTQLSETPVMWLLHRLHTIVEQRQQNPTSRNDRLQLMLQVTTDQPVKVNEIFATGKACMFTHAVFFLGWNRKG